LKNIVFLALIFLATMSLFSQNLLWKSVNVDVGINITTIIQDSSKRLIILSEKGTFILTNLAQIERIDTLLSDSIKISCLAVDSANKIYAGTFKDGVFRLDENSKKWINISSKLENKSIRTITISNNNDIAVGTLNELVYLYNSADSNWSILNWQGSPESFFKILKFNSHGDLFCGSSNYSYRLFQKPEWEKIFDGSKNKSLVNNINFNKQNTYISTNNRSIYFSNDSCRTWTPLFEGLGFEDVREILFTKNDELIVTSYSNGIYYSNNSGTFFEQDNSGLPSLKTKTGIVLDDDTIVISVENEGLFLSAPPKNITIKPGGWIKKNKYLERIASNGLSSKIKFSKDGKQIFTLCENEYKIWDTETGFLIKKKNFQIENFFNLNLSSDDSTCVLRSYYQTYDTIKLLSQIFDIKTDSLIKNLSESYLYKCGSVLALKMLESQSDYDIKQNKLFSSFLYSATCGFGSTNSLYCGSMQIFDFGNDSTLISALSNSPVTSFLRVNNNKIALLINEFKDVYISSIHVYNWSKVNLITIMDFFSGDKISISKTSTDDKSKIEYLPINSINYISSRNLLIGYIYPNKFVFWALDSNIKYDTCYMSQNPIDYQFSYDARTIVTGFNTGIYLLRSPSMMIVDSIPFNDEINYNWRIAISPDSSSFVFSSSDGMIRLVQTDWFKKVDSPVGSVKFIPENLDIILSPNPATDFLEISYSPSINRMVNHTVDGITIYEVFGEKLVSSSLYSIITTQYSAKLDVSGLPAGVYFVKVGDRVGKFIKIEN